MTTTKINTITWLTLIMLIALSYFFAEKGIQNAVYLITLISIIKFILVGFQFMETKKANIFWQVLLILFASTYSISAFLLY